MAQRITWDKYETALLIEAFWKIQENKKDKTIILERLSKDLRQKAVNQGIEIDEIYRNYNGMCYMYGSMLTTFFPEKGKIHTSGIFKEMALLYINEPEKFAVILKDAKEQIKEKRVEIENMTNTKEQFIAWLRDYNDKKCAEVIFLDLFEKVSNYAVKHSISKIEFWNIADYKIFNNIRVKLSGNRIFKFSHPKLFSFFEKWGKLYTLFLKDKYPIHEPKKPEQVTTTHIAMTVEEKREEDAEAVVYLQPTTNVVDDGQAFSKWLLAEGYSESSSRPYLGSLRSISEYAVERLIWDKDVFAFSNDELIEAVKKLLANEDFVQYNIVQHYRFSAALKKYVTFKCGEKDATLLGGRNTAPRGTSEKRRKGNKITERIECPAQLAMILDRSFAYGFGLNVPNDMLRLKSFASMFGVELVDDEELLKLQILAHGVKIEDTVYFFNEAFYAELKEKIEQVFNEGNDVIFYEAFIEKNQMWADERHVVEPLILRELINKCDDSLFFGKTCLVKSEKIIEAEAVVKEVQRVAAGSVLVYVDEVVNQLPYIPEEKIRFHLSVNRWFVRNETNIYVDITKLIYSETEKQDVIDYVASTCHANGYASIVDIPLGNLKENNDLLSENAFYNAVFNLFLYEDYYLNGKIVTKEKNGVDATRLVESYCKNKEKCTVDELVEYVKDITGEGIRRYALEGAYNSMVRIDEDTFVADSFVSFDVDAIDVLLEQYIKDEFDSITSISVFALFPSCGMGWNYYILESYVYRFSKKFRLSYYNLNDKNAGIIVNRKCSLTYEEMLAKEVVRKNIPCEKAAIGTHLCQNGFTAKSKMTLYDTVIEKIKKIKGV